MGVGILAAALFTVTCERCCYHGCDAESIAEAVHTPLG